MDFLFWVDLFLREVVNFLGKVIRNGFFLLIFPREVEKLSRESDGNVLCDLLKIFIGFYLRIPLIYQGCLSWYLCLGTWA